MECARGGAALFWSLSVTSSIVASETTSEPILDYSPRASDTQRQLEEKFNAIPQPAEARRWHRYFTSVPHPAGTERTKQIADPMKKERAKDRETLCVFSRLLDSGKVPSDPLPRAVFMNIMQKKQLSRLPERLMNKGSGPGSILPELESHISGLLGGTR